MTGVRSGSGESQPFRRHAAILLAGGLLLAGIDVIGAFGGALERPDVESLSVLVLAVYVLVLGSLIVWKASGNLVGWAFGGIGVSIAASGLFGIIGDLGVVFVVGLAGALWLSWIGLLALVFLWFPTGRPLTPRWRWASWWVYLTMSLLVLASLFSDSICIESAETSGCAVWVDNPVGIPGMSDAEYGWLSSPLFSSMAMIMLVALASSIVRYRRAGGVERLQLKPFLLATFLFVFAFVTEAITEGLTGAVPAWIDVWLSISLVALPLSATLSILRYRLYDIDRIVSRTVSYVLVVGLLAVVFATGVVWIPTALGLDDSPLLVAGSTLAVAALFNPLRRWVQSWVDRRFNRSRYEAERVIDQFAGSLRDRVDADGVVAGWVGVVSETMQPTVVSVWVRK